MHNTRFCKRNNYRDITKINDWPKSVPPFWLKETGGKFKGKIQVLSKFTWTSWWRQQGSCFEKVSSLCSFKKNGKEWFFIGETWLTNRVCIGKIWLLNFGITKCLQQKFVGKAKISEESSMPFSK